MTKLDELAVGDQLGPLEKSISRPQMFRYSAITWNPRMIHFDAEYTKEVEGHPDILVHATLHGAAVQQLLLEWLGPDGRLCELSYRNVDVAVPEVPLHANAEVTSIDRENGKVELEIWTQQDGENCIEGAATIEVISS